VRVDDLYRSESRRVFAPLIRLLGAFDLAEEALFFRQHWSRRAQTPTGFYPMAGVGRDGGLPWASRRNLYRGTANGVKQHAAAE